MNALELKSIGHVFLGRAVLDGVTLQIGAGEIVALVGPSGCGKSTLAHIAAGLIEPRQGKVIRCCQRHAFVFQEPRLMPWATAEENIRLGLSGQGIRSREARERIADACRAVALEESDLDKFPAQLSGGMRQRTAIARALVGDPDFVYFDEPFTALDAALRRRMQDLVIATVANRGLGGLFITHDMAEAVRISHRIAVLHHRGRGVLGFERLALAPGERSDRVVFETAQELLNDNPLFAHVNDCDDRRIA